MYYSIFHLNGRFFKQLSSNFIFPIFYSKLLSHINIFIVIFACIGKVVFEVSSFSVEIKLRKQL